VVTGLAVAVLLAALAVLVGRRLVAIYRRDRAWAALADKRQWVDRPFDPGLLHGLPAAARRYFCFALHPGTPVRGIAVLATEHHRAGSPRPVRAHAIVAAPHGFLRRGYRGAPPLPVSLTEGLVETGVLAESWLLRLVPWRRGMTPGADAAFERLAIEAALWTPAALLAPAWRWQAVSDDVARIAIEAGGFSATIELTVDAEGRLRAVRGIGKGALAAQPATYVEQSGQRLPGLVEMLFAGASCRGSERIKLMDIRFLEPWMGGSHN
jgi:hypothetical protein